jgi:hypothetical protein
MQVTLRSTCVAAKPTTPLSRVAIGRETGGFVSPSCGQVRGCYAGPGTHTATCRVLLDLERCAAMQYLALSTKRG